MFSRFQVGVRLPRLLITALAWAGFGLCACATVAGLALEAVNHGSPQDLYPGAIIIALLFPLVGAAITGRQPGNLVGWVFLCMGASEALTMVAAPYSVYALYTHPAGAPGGAFASWVATIIWLPGFSLVTLLLILFPTGRPPSWRWSVIAWLAVVGTAVDVLIMGIASWPYRGRYLVVHNDSVPFAKGSVISAISAVVGAVIVATLVASVVCAILRFRDSRGVVRQQMKWCAYSTATATIILLVSIWLLPNGGNLNGRPLDTIVLAMQTLAFAMVPTCVGIAILRYRLFDIDVIIKRTLVYGSLTAILAVLYFGLIIGAQTTVQGITGQRAAQQSPVVVVVSTLLIAALFQPLRRRIQRVIDMRFYRSRYDAVKTAERFAASLRQVVELDQLREDLLATIDETMKPAHASLWLSSSGTEGGPK